MTWRALLLWALVPWLLFGCGGQAFRRVPLAIGVSCVPATLGPKPEGLESKESLAAAPSADQRYQRLYADWKLRVARMLETEPVIERCR